MTAWRIVHRWKGSGLVAALAMFAGMMGASAAQAASPAASASPGNSSAVAGVEVDLGSLPAAAENMLAPSPPAARGGASDAVYKQRKADAAVFGATLAGSRQALASFPGPSAASSDFIDDVLTPGASKSFPGAQQIGTIRPSDMALAVSPAYVVQVVNSQILVLNKSGVIQAGFPKSLGTFFAAVGASTDVGDPRAFYDWQKSKFVVVADDFTLGNIYVATSTTSNPTGAWRVYSFHPWAASASCRIAGRDCPDFPMIGFDSDTIYVSLNMFYGAGGMNSWMLLLPKAKLYAGQAFSYNYWFNFTVGGVAVDTMQPVTPLRGSEMPRAGFAIHSYNIYFGGGQCSAAWCNGLGLWSFSNNLVAAGSPGPQWSFVNIPTANNYRMAADANQLGGAHTIDTLDVRISASPTFHAGLINAALVTQGPGTAGYARPLWFQVRPFLNDGAAACTGSFLYKCAQLSGAEIVNEDCYYCGGGVGANGSWFFPALAPDDAGNLTMGAVYSDDNSYPGTAYVSRRVTQAKNTLHDNGIWLCPGASYWAGGRFGDYSAAAGDIQSAIQNYMWFSTMGATAGGHWGGCIGRNGFTAVNQP